MRDRELIVHARLTLTHHRDVFRRLPEALQAAEFEALPLAASSYDKPIVAGGEGSDPTSTAGIAAATRRPDRTSTLRAELERSLAMIAVHVDIAAAAALELLEVNDPKKAKALQQERIDLAKTNGSCCRSCARAWSSPGTPWLVDPHVKRFDGATQETWRLCKTCDRFNGRFGRFPTTEEVQHHHDHGVWPPEYDDTPGKRTRKPA